MYTRDGEDFCYVGWVDAYVCGLNFGTLFDGDSSDRDDVPSPYIPDGQDNPEYSMFCDDQGCAYYYEIAVNV